MEIGVSFGVGEQELWKENATVGDLIKILQEFPTELRVSAFFECVIEGEDIVALEDRRMSTLLEIILDCPFCKEHIEVCEHRCNSCNETIN